MKKSFHLISLMLFLLSGLMSLPLSAQNFPGEDGDAVWDGRSRFTVLIMGMDRRPGARDNLNARTDVIIIASYDPQTRNLGLLSIPRDMHFALIDIGELVRVNTLLVRGESREENLGPRFAMDTLQANLGMYIDAYIIFDFSAFIDVIDLIGGVTVSVPYNISDPTYPDMNYGFDPFFLNAGTHTLDGRNALKYARTRHGDNDYLRGQRQLQIVQAVRERLTDISVVQLIIGQAPSLLAALQGHVYTNITPELMLMMGLTLLELNSEQISTGAINQAYSYDYNSPTAGIVRVPDRALLAGLLTEVFGAEYWR